MLFFSLCFLCDPSGLYYKQLQELSLHRVWRREEETMPQQLETREQDFSKRVITALTHLAALSRRTSTLRAAPPETLNQLATTLIHRFATLCGAQRGALLLARHTPHQDAATLQGAFAGQPLFSLIAGVQMSEEEARAVLATYPSLPRPRTGLWISHRPWSRDAHSTRRRRTFLLPILPQVISRSTLPHCSCLSGLKRHREYGSTP